VLRIALLKADFVNPELIPVHGDLPDMFRRFFGAAKPLELDVFDVRTGHFPEPSYACDAFVITGSRNCALDEIPWVARLRHFIAERAAGPNKLIGFCFGHQILATSLGGRVDRAPRGWNVGVRPMQIMRRRSWMAPSRTALNVLFNHRDQVLEPPAGSTVLAGDERCPVQMFELGQQVLGVQAHPEYTIEYQNALMDVAAGMTDAVRRDARARNQALRADNEVALGWLLRFIRS
jgi:GMP synthase-like glutamine amidotransferase